MKWFRGAPRILAVVLIIVFAAFLPGLRNSFPSSCLGASLVGPPLRPPAFAVSSTRLWGCPPTPWGAPPKRGVNPKSGLPTGWGGPRGPLPSCGLRREPQGRPLKTRRLGAPLHALKRPYYVLDEEGNFKIESRDPPESEIFKGWADLIAEEERLWGPTPNAAAAAAAAAAKGERPLAMKEKINERLLQGRKAAIADRAYTQPFNKPQLWIVRPKQGPYCELMKEDEPRLNSLIKKLRWKYDSSVLPVGDIKMQAEAPLCEVFLAGPFPGICRIFYARGATLQYRVRPRFRTVCPLLEKDERLKQKYGGDGCPGLFPTWDEEGILEEIDECMNLPPDHMLSYPVNLEWDNVAGLSPENQSDRPWWYNNVHYPTRQAVQRAFEEGVADFRTVIETEYKMIKEHDRKEGERLAHLKMIREREKKGF
ncbi:hypothetical protein Emed_003050 [Eimeria media]